MLVRANVDGTYSATWTPSSVGCYSILVNIDGYEMEEAFKVEVHQNVPLRNYALFFSGYSFRIWSLKLSYLPEVCIFILFPHSSQEIVSYLTDPLIWFWKFKTVFTELAKQSSASETSSTSSLLFSLCPRIFSYLAVVSIRLQICIVSRFIFLLPHSYFHWVK